MQGRVEVDGVIVIVVNESRGNPRDSQVERTIGCGDVRNRRRKDPVVGIEGIDYRVCIRGEVEKGLGVAVFSRGTFRVRVDHVVVNLARGVFVELEVTGRTRSTVSMGLIVIDRARGNVRLRSTIRVDHVLVDRVHGVVVDRGRGKRRRLVRSVEGSERVLQGGYGRGCHCGAR